MKRSDLSERAVLAAVDAHGADAWDMLTLTFPPKVVLAAMRREVDAGNLDYGVWLGRPWLTDKGRDTLTPRRRPPADLTITTADYREQI